MEPVKKTDGKRRVGDGTAGPGRPKGVPNKTTAEIKALAVAAAPLAMATLIQLAQSGRTEQTRVAASKEILDRALGKATQPIGQDPELGQLGVLLVPHKTETPT